MKMMVFRPLLCTLLRLNWAKQNAGDNEAKLMTKLAPEWVRTRDPVIRSPARYRWTTAPAPGRRGTVTGDHTVFASGSTLSIPIMFAVLR